VTAEEPYTVDHYYSYLHETAWNNIEEASRDEQEDIGVRQVKQLSETDRKQNPNQSTKQKNPRKPNPQGFCLIKKAEIQMTKLAILAGQSRRKSLWKGI